MGNTYQPQQPIQYQQPMMPPQKLGDPRKNGTAVAGFVLSLIGLLLCAGKFPIILAIVGLILSLLSVKSQRKGLSTAGIVLGIIGIVMGIAFIAGAGDSPTENTSLPATSIEQGERRKKTQNKESSSDSTDNQVSAIGTRKNPAKIGDTVNFEMDSFVYGKATLEITLVEIIRGEDAAEFVAEANSFNSEPESGKEYVLATFKIKNIKDNSDDDSPVTINGAQFSFANGSFAKEDQMNFITTGQSLSSELYEGAEATGIVDFIADSGDNCYAVYQDKIWFALS